MLSHKLNIAPTRTQPNRPAFKETERNRDALAAFYGVCRVVDILLLCKRRALTPAEGFTALRRDVPAFLRAHIAAHGVDTVRPKHHWLMHVAEQLQQDSALLDLFVVERLHLRVLRQVRSLHNTRTFERTAVGFAVVDHVNVCENLPVGLDGLVGYTAPFGTARIADKLRFEGLEVAVDDVVWRGTDCGRVLACLNVAGELYLVVNPFEKTDEVWNPIGDTRLLWCIEQVAPSLAWFATPAGLVVLRLWLP